MLGEPGGRIKHEFEPAEELFAEFRFTPEVWKQGFPTSRHVQIDSGSDFPEIANGFLKQVRCGLAVVNIKRAAVVEHEPDIVTAAERVIPGKPIDNHRRLFFQKRPRLRSGLHIGAQHPLRIDDGLGLPRRSGREQEFRNRLRPNSREGALDGRYIGVRRQGGHIGRRDQLEIVMLNCC